VSPSALIEEMAKNLNRKSDIDCKFYETSLDIPYPRNLSLDYNNLIIYHNPISEKQTKRKAYYIRGRHSNVDCFYLF